MPVTDPFQVIVVPGGDEITEDKRDAALLYRSTEKFNSSIQVGAFLPGIHRQQFPNDVQSMLPSFLGRNVSPPYR